MATLLHLVRSGMPATSISVCMPLLSPASMRSLAGRTLHDHLIRCLLAGASQLPMPTPLESMETGIKR